MATQLHQRLSEAAKAGDIDELYNVLQEDPYILDGIDQIPFAHTPLHVAVCAGQACFVQEITNLKLSFARKLDSSGYSPLHLAAANGHVEIAKQLLKVDSCLSVLRGREKRTPLHCAAMAGSIGAVDALIFQCPKSLLKKTIRKETALHLAVKHGQLETVEALLRWIGELNMKNLLILKDLEGNTPLDLATSFRQDQNMSEILRKAESMGGLNLKINNLCGHTPTNQPALAIHHRQKIFRYFNFRVNADTSTEVRNTLLVILVLIAAATFQIGITPPGGNWQDDLTDSNKNNHTAGDPIWKDKDPVGYFIFTAINCSGFLLSSVMIFRLVEGYPYSGPVQLAQSFLVYTYVLTNPWLSIHGKGNSIYLSIFLGFVVPIGVVALHWIHRKPKNLF